MTLDDLHAAPNGARLVPIDPGRVSYVKNPGGMWSATGGFADLRTDQLAHILRHYRLQVGSPSMRYRG